MSAWRHWINKELPHALDWDESPTAPFDEAEVGEQCTSTLRLLACHAATGDSLPNELPNEWERRPEAGGMFSQVAKPQLWLPGEHDFLFEVRELDERLIWIGSSEELLRELEAMARHWNTELESRPALAANFVRARQVIEPLARRSVEFRLPLRLIPG